MQQNRDDVLRDRESVGCDLLKAADIRRLDASEILAPCEAPYPVWSPYDAFEGAATVMQLLEQEKAA